MAEPTIKVECYIQDIKQIPNSTNQIVSVHFRIGDREWFKAFRLAYDRPISMEEFKRELARVGIFPEEEQDFLAYVKQQGNLPFSIEVSADEPDESEKSDS